jgi:glycosyltransferase involved in cell wall biosynthesis
MKLAIINHGIPPDVGGGETQTYVFAEKLSRMGNSVTVITGDIGGYRHYPFKVVKLEHFKLFEKGIAGVKCFVKELKDAVTREEFDIIFCNNFSAALGLSFFADLVRSKIVFSFHCGPIREQNKIVGYFDDWDLELAYVRSILRALPYDHIVCGGKKYYTWALEFGLPAKKVSMVHYCVDVHHFGAKPEIEWKIRHQIPTNMKILVTSVRLLEKKGIIDLVNSIPLMKSPVFAYIAASLKNGSLVVKDTVERLISDLGIQDRIRIAYDNHDYFDMPEVLANSDVFVLPSHHEGFGISILEAMASKKPVLCSNIDGIREFVRHEENGLLFSPKSPIAIAKSVDRILSEEDLAKTLVENAYRQVIKKYSVDVQGAKLSRLFSDLIAN